MYTGLSAKWTLVAFAALFILHSLAILIVKLITSEDYRKGGIRFQKVADDRVMHETASIPLNTF